MKNTIKKAGLENLTLTGHVEGKRIRMKHRAAELTSLSEWIMDKEIKICLEQQNVRSCGEP